MHKLGKWARFMDGKKSKSVKQKPTKQKKNKQPMTFEEKLSDTKGRMNRIVEGDDPRYHLR
jgi:hypothetical protein